MKASWSTHVFVGDEEVVSGVDVYKIEEDGEVGTIVGGTKGPMLF